VNTATSGCYLLPVHSVTQAKLALQQTKNYIASVFSPSALFAVPASHRCWCVLTSTCPVTTRSARSCGTPQRLMRGRWEC
jgi:hypothetical protein